MPDFAYETPLWEKRIVAAGIDEAGRGAIAGPVVAAAVIISGADFDCEGIDDSKKIPAVKRSELFEKLCKSGIIYNYAAIDNHKIDEINILRAAMLAMKEAAGGLSERPGHLLIDGNRYEDNSIPFTTIIGGDALSISIAAASIIAKVVRDRWMIETAHAQYPEYGFDRHKGYGTRAHYDAIEKNGLCALHRNTFLRKFFARQYELFE
ncbi:MAG: ribonuclease HII [Bacteroidota bacterium]